MNEIIPYGSAESTTRASDGLLPEVPRRHGGQSVFTGQVFGFFPLEPIGDSAPYSALSFQAPHTECVFLPFNARFNGLRVGSTRGSGKSTFLGRYLAFSDFCLGMPLVVLDPIGETIDRFFAALGTLPRKIQEKAWERVLYVDVGGVYDHVVPLPSYYRLGNESWETIAARPPDVIYLTDPDLGDAPVQGRNAVQHIGETIGVILGALGCQITEADSLLLNPKLWLPQIQQVAEKSPEVLRAFETLVSFPKNIVSFIAKTDIFRFDPAMRAMFGAGRPGIDWHHVIEGRKAVLFDFRHIHNIERRRFTMAWVHHYFQEFIRHRGPGYQHVPVSLIIDEFAALPPINLRGAELFATEFRNFVDQRMRNHRIWLTVAHQELYQLPDGLQRTLLGLGNQMQGTTTDPDAALRLARQFCDFNPYQLKKVETVYGSMDGLPIAIDERTIEFTLDEQEYMYGKQFRQLGRFQFLVKIASGEGDPRGTLQWFSLPAPAPHTYPSDRQLEDVRRELMQRHGRPIKEVLAEIEARLAAVLSQQRQQPDRHKRYHRKGPRSNNERRQLPAFGEKAATAQAHSPAS